MLRLNYKTSLVVIRYVFIYTHIHKLYRQIYTIYDTIDLYAVFGGQSGPNVLVWGGGTAAPDPTCPPAISQTRGEQ